MADKLKAVEDMIAKVMRKKELSHAAAVDYMLAVATGRLAALWRYDDAIEKLGKPNKGVFKLAGKKKPAEKTAKILPTIEQAEKIAKRKSAKKPAAEKKPKAAKKAKAAKKRAKKEAEPAAEIAAE